MSLDPQACIRMKDMPVQERPRERLVAVGAENLKTSELLAILLRTGSKGISAIDLGERLIHQFGSLDKLARAPLADLQKVKGVGRDKAIALKAAFTLAQRMAAELHGEAPLLDTPERVADLLREENRSFNREVFQVVLLNTRRRLIRVERLSDGTLDTLLVHARDVFLLCCDGLTKMVADAEIGFALGAATSAADAANELVAKANLHGGEDNITALVIQISAA